MSRIRRNAAILDKVYPVGSVYIDANNANTCPMAAAISGSTWTKIGTKLLTNASTAPVVGNGKCLGVTNGTINAGLLGHGGGYNSSLANADVYGADVGTATKDWSTGKVIRENNAIGVVTDPDNSGLVAKLSEATGLNVTLWKRTA